MENFYYVFLDYGYDLPHNRLIEFAYQGDLDYFTNTRYSFDNRVEGVIESLEYLLDDAVVEFGTGFAKTLKLFQDLIAFSANTDIIAENDIVSFIDKSEINNESSSSIDDLINWCLRELPIPRFRCKDRLEQHLEFVERCKQGEDLGSFLALYELFESEPVHYEVVLLPAVQIVSSFIQEVREDRIIVSKKGLKTLKTRFKIVPALHCYRINSFDDLLFASLYEAFSHNKSIEKCDQCKRYFFPRYRAKTVYCHLQSLANPNRSCREQRIYTKGRARRQSEIQRKYDSIRVRYYQKRDLYGYRNLGGVIDINDSDYIRIDTEFEIFKSKYKEMVSQIANGDATDEDIMKWMRTIVIR